MYDFSRIRYLVNRNEFTEAVLEGTEVIGSRADAIRKKLQLVDELYDLENETTVMGLNEYRFKLYVDLKKIARNIMGDIDYNYFVKAFMDS